MGGIWTARPGVLIGPFSRNNDKNISVARATLAPLNSVFNSTYYTRVEKIMWTVGGVGVCPHTVPSEAEHDSGVVTKVQS